MAVTAGDAPAFDDMEGFLRVAKYTLVKSTDMNTEMKEEVCSIMKLGISVSGLLAILRLPDLPLMLRVERTVPPAGHGYLHHSGGEVPERHGEVHPGASSQDPKHALH